MIKRDKMADLFVRGLPDVQHLTPQREHAILVPSDDAETGHGQTLGRVSFRHDQSAFVRVLLGCLIGVFELSYSLQPRMLSREAFLVQLTLHTRRAKKKNYIFITDAH